MLVTIVCVQGDRTRLHQIDAPKVKDCLVAWAGRVDIEVMSDEQRTRLRGEMADFQAPPIEGLVGCWQLETDLGMGQSPKAALIVVETVLR
jgi:hypothetical protein